jgi:aspartyl protease family protein
MLTAAADWQNIAVIAVVAALALMLLQRLPLIGPVVRFAMSLGLMALSIFLLLQVAPYQPLLSSLTQKLGLSRQDVVGREVRIAMATDGHFWADARVNGVERRMLIDSGATVTAFSADTAAVARIERSKNLLPVILQTANGMTPADTGTIASLRIGGIEARDLKVVISPALGRVDVIGMNFLSELASWRVEGRTLILTPRSAAVP